MRGCEKKIYYVKNAESEYFEEAYFILRRESGAAITATSGTLAEEADRIIHETGGRFGKKARAPIHRLPPTLAFALGAVASSAFIGTVALIVGLA